MQWCSAKRPIVYICCKWSDLIWDDVGLSWASTFKGLDICLFRRFWDDFQVSQTFCWWLPMENKLINKRGGSGLGVHFTISLSDLSGCHWGVWWVDQITFTLTSWSYRSLSYYFYALKDPMFFGVFSVSLGITSLWVTYSIWANTFQHTLRQY